MDTALQIADALAKLHALNIAHRDLSPRNILRSRIGTFKLGDFGVSRTCRETLHGCAAAAFVGTVAYAAPEDSGDALCSVTVAADVWAFAATFVEAATGAPPYGDVSWKRVLRCHMQGVAPNLEGHAAAKKMLAACFAMDASARPSAADLLERLLACKPQLCADPSAPVLRPAAAAMQQPAAAAATAPAATPQPAPAAPAAAFRVAAATPTAVHEPAGVAAMLRDAVARGMRQAVADDVLQQLGGGDDATCLRIASLNAADCLDLYSNSIGAEGAAALAPSLALLTQLRHLDIGDNYIGAEGAAALAPSLALLKQLAYLNMGGNAIGDGRRAALAVVAAAIEERGGDVWMED